jgi:hypothetical protein
MGIVRKPKRVVTVTVSVPRFGSVQESWKIAKGIRRARVIKKSEKPAEIKEFAAIERRLAPAWHLRSATTVQKLVDQEGLSRHERYKRVLFSMMAHSKGVDTKKAIELLKTGATKVSKPYTHMGFFNIDEDVMADIDVNDYRSDIIDQLFANSSLEIKTLLGDSTTSSRWAENYIAQNIARTAEAFFGPGETKLLLREGYDGILTRAGVAHELDTAPRETDCNGKTRTDNQTSFDIAFVHNGKRMTMSVKCCSPCLGSSGRIQFQARDVGDTFDILACFLLFPDGPHLFACAAAAKPTSYLNQGFSITLKGINSIPAALVGAGFVEIPDVTIDALLIQRMRAEGIKDIVQPPAPGMSHKAQGDLYEDFMLRTIGARPVLAADGRRDRYSDYDGTLAVDGTEYKLEAKCGNAQFDEKRGVWSFSFNKIKSWLYDTLVLGLRVMHVSDSTRSTLTFLRCDPATFDNGDTNTFSTAGFTTTGDGMVGGFDIRLNAHENSTCMESMWVSVVSMIRRLVRDSDNVIKGLAPRIGITQAWSDTAFGRETKHLVDTKVRYIPAAIKRVPQLQVPDAHERSW